MPRVFVVFQEHFFIYEESTYLLINQHFSQTSMKLKSQSMKISWIFLVFFKRLTAMRENSVTMVIDKSKNLMGVGLIQNLCWLGDPLCVPSTCNAQGY